MNIVVLDGHTLNPGDLDWRGLEAYGEVTVYDRTPAEKIVERAEGAEITLTNKTPLREATLDRLPDLRYIGVLATGYDVVDTEAAAARDIVVTNVPTYATQAVAQMTLALLLELCHHVQAHGTAVKEGAWSASPDFSFWNTPLVELAGKTMALVGFGRIGRATAKLADAFGMTVLAVEELRENPPDYEGFRWARLDEAFTEADVISFHCPLTDATRGIVNKDTLAGMKPTAFLINTARGDLVVEEDLAAALKEGRLAGAAVDVLSREPPRPDNPLVACEKCLVTPHIAWATKASRRRLMATAGENVAAFLDGSPRNVVN
jgi:glycerate dehydrogenase